MRFKKTLAWLVFATTLILASGNNSRNIISHSSKYGFPDYKQELLNKQYNWDSNDVLDNKGWQVINKKSEELKQIDPKLKYTDLNILCFKPISDFKTFSTKDNYATFHLHTEKPIKTFSIGGEYYIQKNGYINISVSGDNKNWVLFQYFDTRGKDDYTIAWGHAPYYPSQLELKLNKDLYIKHCAGANSNQNYEVEIWRASFSVSIYNDFSK